MGHEPHYYDLRAYHYMYNGVLVSLRNYVVEGSTDLPGIN